MTTLRKAAEQALEALEAETSVAWECSSYHPKIYSAITALRQALKAKQMYKTTGWLAPRDQYAIPVLFNPYSGEPRDVRDVQSDPQGVLIVPPGKVEMIAATPTCKRSLQVEQNAEPVACEEPDCCPHCGGSGDVMVMDSAGPDAHEVPVNCPHCGGDGTLASAYRGVLKLLEAESAKHLKVCAELYFRPSAPQPAQQPLTDARVAAIVANYCLNVGDWTRNGESVARAIERAHGIGGEA